MTTTNNHKITLKTTTTTTPTKKITLKTTTTPTTTKITLKTTNDVHASINENATINKTLKTHQQQAITWMNQRTSGLLDIEMGGGKTLIALAHALQHTGQTLIITKPNIIPEIEKQTTQHNNCNNHQQLVYTYHGPNRNKYTQRLNTAKIIITSYQTILQEHKHNKQQSHIYKQTFQNIYIDEIHEIRNNKNKTTIAVKNIKHTQIWGLTGTPIINQHKDIQTIADITHNQNKPHKEWIKVHKHTNNTQLPPHHTHNHHIQMTPEQKQNEKNIQNSDIHHLHKITLLKQNNTHPSLTNKYRQQQGLHTYPNNTHSTKTALIQKIITQNEQKGHNTIIYSQYTTTLKLIKKICKFTHTPLLYTGQQHKQQKQKNIHTYKNTPGTTILIQYHTGATGIDLTTNTQTHNIYTDEWWNTKIKEQCKARTNRPPQKQPTHTHNIHTQQSHIEDTIHKIQHTKQHTYKEYHTLTTQ